MQITCKHCKKLTPEGALCMYCGGHLAPQVECPGCKHLLAAGSQKCQYCGANVVAVKPPELIPCPKCGKKMGAHLSACLMCGAALRRGAPQPAQAPPQGAPASELDRLLHQANLAMQAQKWAEALACLEQALKLNTTRADMWNAKGACLHNLKCYADAIACYQQALQLHPRHHETLYNLGNSLRLAGQTDEAVKHYEAALALNPAHAACMGNLAVTLRELGRYDESLPMALGMLMSRPGELAFANVAGLCFLKTGKLNEALRFLKQAAEGEPRRAAYWIDYGLCLQAMQRQSDADGCFEQASKLDPITARPNFYKATLLERAQKLSDAAEYFYRASSGFMIEQRNSLLSAQSQLECAQARAGLKRLKAHLARAADASGMFAEAKKSEAAGESEEALAMYEEAAVLDPDNAQALDGVVRMRKARAEKNARPRSAPPPAAPKPQPPAPAKPVEALGRDTLLDAALAQENAGQHEAALESYARFLTKPGAQREQIQLARQHHAELIERLRPPRVKPPPSPAAALLDRAAQLLAKQHLQQAVAAYDEALELDSQCVVAWLNMGACLDQLGRPEDAIKSFDRAVKILPQMAGVWVMRATCLSALGRHEDALRDLNKAIELDPYENSAWGNKGSCLNALHRTAEALPCLERALVLQPFNVIAWFNRGCTERTLGKKDAAIASFQRFLALAPQGVEDQIEDAQRMLKELQSHAPPSDVREQTMRLPAKPLEVLGEYEIFKELGRGGMGVVYLAVRTPHDDVCALKTFLDPADAAAAAAFKREAKTWIELDRHPHLVSAYYVDEIRGRLYIAMEFVMPGPEGLNSLEGYLRSSPPGLNQTLRWSIQFCHGMEYAYTKGIRCHRDIKPANIMIDWKKNLKITDFGLAAALTTAPNAPQRLPVRGGARGAVGLSVFTEGGGSGTPTHMPPEQWRSGSACDERSDIYAFGITLYQMASQGKLPFLAPLPKNDSPEESQRFMVQMYQMHCAETPRPLDSVLWPAIARCMQKDPARRYAAFKDLRYDLEVLLQGQAQGETVAPPVAGKLDAEERVNKALSLDALQRYDEALALFDAILKSEPALLSALEGKACTLEKMGRLDEALRLWDRALALDPRAATAQLSKGNALLNAGRPADALTCYESALNARPDYAMAWRNKAPALRKLQRDQEALACFEQALKLEPNSSLGWKDQGDALRLLGRHADALQSLKRAVELDPGSSDAWNLLGETNIALQQFDVALQCFEKAVSLDPRNYSACVNRGGCLTRAGRLADAMASYDAALKLDDKPAMAWNNKGDLFLRAKQPDEALKCFDRALECDPTHALALQNKALQLRDRKRIDEGLALLERGVAAHPQSTSLWYFKAEFLSDKQQYEAAVAAYRKVIEFEKTNARAIGMAWCHSGACSEKLGAFGDAYHAYRKAGDAIANYTDAIEGAERCKRKVQGGGPMSIATAQRAPSVEAWLAKARAFKTERKFHDAVNGYTEALDEDPNCVEAWCELGVTLGILKDYPRALVCLNRALTFDANSAAIWLNKAMTEEAAGLKHEALASYKKFVGLAPATLEKHLEHAKQRIAALTPHNHRGFE